MPRKSLYLPDAVDALVDARGDSYSGRVAFLVTLAHELQAPPRPALSGPEMRVITQAVAGYVPAYDRGPAAVLRGAWHAVFDRAADGVDTAALAKKLAALPMPEQAWIFERARAAVRE